MGKWRAVNGPVGWVGGPWLGDENLTFTILQMLNVKTNYRNYYLLFIRKVRNRVNDSKTFVLSRILPTEKK